MSSLIENVISNIEQMIMTYENMENEIPVDDDRLLEVESLQQSGFYSHSEIELLKTLQNRKDLLYRQLQEIAGRVTELRSLLSEKAEKTQQFVFKFRLAESVVSNLSKLMKDAYDRLERMEFWIEDRKRDFNTTIQSLKNAEPQEQQAASSLTRSILKKNHHHKHQQASQKTESEIQPEQTAAEESTDFLQTTEPDSQEVVVQIPETPLGISLPGKVGRKFKLRVTPSLVENHQVSNTSQPPPPILFKDPLQISLKQWTSPSWRTLHLAARTYPLHPTLEDEQRMERFIVDFGTQMLPCNKCKVDFAQQLAQHPLSHEILSSRESLNRWLYEMHKRINTTNGGSLYPIEQTDAYIRGDLQQQQENCSSLWAWQLSTILLGILLLVLFVVIFVKWWMNKQKNIKQ